MSVAQNISLPNIATTAPVVLASARRPKSGWPKRKSQRMRIKTPTIHRKVVNLSGGNQQKVVLGKWLAMQPKVLILDEPTRGIDVGAKAEIYRHMATLADQGITIIMVSSDMEEVLGMSDRVAVMHERRITGILPRGRERRRRRSASLMTGQRVGQSSEGPLRMRRELGMFVALVADRASRCGLSNVDFLGHVERQRHHAVRSRCSASSRSASGSSSSPAASTSPSGRSSD